MINNDLYCENGKKRYLNQRLTMKAFLTGAEK